MPPRVSAIMSAVGRESSARWQREGTQGRGRRIIALCFATAVLGHLPVRGVDSVSKQHRSFLLASLLPAFLLVSVFAVVQAQNAGTPAAKQARWSDPATWPDRKVPVAGDKVTIAEGKDVVLDVSPPALDGLTIDGKLSFANNGDLELTTEWIMVHGELEIGTEARPHTRKATITLTNNVKDEDIGGMGGANDRSDRGIMLMGGTLNLHGNRTNSWTKLASTATAGSTSIQVLNAAGWRRSSILTLNDRDSLPSRKYSATSDTRRNEQSVYRRIDSPYWKMTKNRSGKAARDNPAPPPLGPCRCHRADDSRPTADMMALTRGGVKDSHE